jgi:hypothetical protein
MCESYFLFLPPLGLSPVSFIFNILLGTVSVILIVALIYISLKAGDAEHLLMGYAIWIHTLLRRLKFFAHFF